MNFAIIGFGGMGQFHASLLKRFGVGQVTAVYDIDEECQRLALRQGYKSHKTEAELWQNSHLFEAAIIATPNDVHAYYCQKLAEFGKHAICEKPATLCEQEFLHMKSFSESAKTILEIHQNRRWDHDFLSAMRIASSGIIGKVYRIESCVTGANGIPGGWRKEARHGGGMMLDWGVHLIDQACIFAGSSKIKNLFSRYSYILGFEVEDGFELDLEFDCGLLYNIVVDTNMLIQKPRWVLYGLDGTAQISDWNYNGKIVVKKEHTQKLVGIKAGNGFTKTMAERPKEGTEVFDLPIFDHNEGEFYKNFVSACNGEENMIVKNEEVLRVLKIMDKAKLSAQNNEFFKNLNI